MNNFAHNYEITDSYYRSSSPANKLEPLKRPMSTMTPVMVFDKGKLELITGKAEKNAINLLITRPKVIASETVIN